MSQNWQLSRPWLIFKRLSYPLPLCRYSLRVLTDLSVSCFVPAPIWDNKFSSVMVSVRLSSANVRVGLACRVRLGALLARSSCAKCGVTCEVAVFTTTIFETHFLYVLLVYKLFLVAVASLSLVSNNYWLLYQQRLRQEYFELFKKQNFLKNLLNWSTIFCPLLF